MDVAALLAGSVSANTARNYRQDWTRFTTWCTEHGYVALPAAPATVAAYLQAQAEVRTETGERRYAIATLTRWVAAIGFVHRAHAALGQAGGGGGGGEGLPPPAAVGDPGRSELVRATLAALRRDYTRNRDRPTRRVAPLLLDDITRILTATRADAGTWTTRLRERRDTALLLLGFAGAFRRTELAALRIGDIAHKPGVGLHIRVASSKTDQDGHGHTKALTHGTSSI